MAKSKPIRSFVLRWTPALMLASIAVLRCLAQQAPAAAAAAPPAAAAQPGGQPGNAEIDEGQRFLRANQPEKALAAFQQALKADPENATANLLAASAALNLFEPEVAVGYAEEARRLAPNDWHVDPTLVVVYASAGKTAERDVERQKLVALHGSANAPDGIKVVPGFMLDYFRVKDYRVEAVQYFKPVGKFHTYYRFIVRNHANKQVWVYDLQSDDFGQKSWAEAHPQDAAAGGRQYSLESDSGQAHTEYRLFSGDASYDAVRAVVVRLLLDRTEPFPAEAAPTAPAVQ